MLETIPVQVEVDADISEIKTPITFQCLEIIKKAEKEGVCIFELDDSEDSYLTIRQLKKIAPPSGYYFVREERGSYNLMNMQSLKPDSGKFMLIVEKKKFKV